MITCHFIIAYNAHLNNPGNVKNRERVLQAFAVHQALSLPDTANIAFCNFHFHSHLALLIFLLLSD